MNDRTIEAPMGLLLELTHRCPLRCPYCSNPLALERGAGELDTVTWLRVLEEAAGLAVLQAHFSGGEPTVRKDLPQLVAAAAGLGLYSNLITSGVFLDGQRVAQLQEAGLDHIQISLQDVEPDDADRIGGYPGGHIRKLEAARLSCKRREIDLGGCRCQAFALTGDAATADPACALSPGHTLMTRAVVESAATSRPVFIYRRQILST
jgi:MoaA/NifB/PqqE/SkfB family radical SAM enzyme